MDNPVDFVYHYLVHKSNPNTFTNMDKLITSIVYYVQNHEVYFDYEVHFVDGVLVFGIVGYTEDHMELQRELGESFKELGCVLKFSTFNKLADK